MSAKALHINLLSAQEAIPKPRALSTIVLPCLAGFALAAVVCWGIVLCVQISLAGSHLRQVKAKIAMHTAQSAQSGALKAEYRDLLAENAQYQYYVNGRRPRGNMLKGIADVVPDSVMLTELKIPPPPEQKLKPPPGVPLMPMQGTTQTVDQVELRITGLARDESGVFKLMENIRNSDFTNFLENVSSPDRENPRVLSFRQETTRQPGAGAFNGVFFDLAYDLKPREYLKK